MLEETLLSYFEVRTQGIKDRLDGWTLEVQSLECRNKEIWHEAMEKPTVQRPRIMSTTLILFPHYFISSVVEAIELSNPFS